MTVSLLMQAEMCRTLLGYNDGDLLDNVKRYKAYAESEIALRDRKASEGIAYIEKLQKELDEANKQLALDRKVRDDCLADDRNQDRPGFEYPMK